MYILQIKGMLEWSGTGQPVAKFEHLLLSGTHSFGYYIDAFHKFRLFVGARFNVILDLYAPVILR